LRGSGPLFYRVFWVFWQLGKQKLKGLDPSFVRKLSNRKVFYGSFWFYLLVSTFLLPLELFGPDLSAPAAAGVFAYPFLALRWVVRFGRHFQVGGLSMGL
jgi:hypothetical protein